MKPRLEAPQVITFLGVTIWTLFYQVVHYVCIIQYWGSNAIPGFGEDTEFNDSTKDSKQGFGMGFSSQRTTPY